MTQSDTSSMQAAILDLLAVISVIEDCHGCLSSSWERDLLYTKIDNAADLVGVPPKRRWWR